MSVTGAESGMVFSKVPERRSMPSVGVVGSSTSGVAGGLVRSSMLSQDWFFRSITLHSAISLFPTGDPLEWPGGEGWVWLLDGALRWGMILARSPLVFPRAVKEGGSSE